MHRNHLNALYGGGLGGVFRRDAYVAAALFFGLYRHRKDAADAFADTGKGQFPDKAKLLHRELNLPGGIQNAHQNGEIVIGAGFSDVRRGKVD